MNVLACASNFGLGPTGKLASIVSKSLSIMKDDIKWYASGDKIDTAIFEKDIFVEKCWSRDEKQIVEFVRKYDIKVAVVILDPDIAIILEKNGVKVFFVDSLPFLWTEADIVPFESTMYFAQKCVKMNQEATRVINKVKNLKWINPIICEIGNSSISKRYKIVINLGGLHTSIGNNTGYINLVIIPMIKQLQKIYKLNDILITCGTKAWIEVNDILKKNKINGIDIKTLVQKDFMNYVVNCDLFITSPGMTTIYETCKYDKDTILLPPQNLSQYYNSEFAKKLIKRMKLIKWNKEELNLDYLKQYFYLGEDQVVDIIYKNINIASKDIKYKEKLYKRIGDILRRKYTERKVICFDENGAETIVMELLKLDIMKE